MLHIEDLIAGYGKSEALHGVSVSIGAGKVVALIGANGAGKSTLVNTISRLLPISSGRIEFEGADVSSLSAADMVELGVIQVPEGRKLFGSLTVDENLMLGSYNSRAVRKSSEASRKKFVLKLFPILAERSQQRAATLSGGEQQMVAMGRALMMAPSVLLLDEPSAGLSPALQDEVFVRVKGINASGVTVIIVEQNARRCLQIVDRGYVLDQGKNAYTGTGASLANDPKVIELYLGTLAKA